MLDPRVLAPHAIARFAAETPDVVALQHVDGTSMTYAVLDAECRTWADALRRLGVGAGTHVGTMLTNRFEAHRIGMEDGELLAQLKRKDPARAQAIIAEVVKGFDDYCKDVTVYRAARKDLLEAVDQISK